MAPTLADHRSFSDGHCSGGIKAAAAFEGCDMKFDLLLNGEHVLKRRSSGSTGINCLGNLIYEIIATTMLEMRGDGMRKQHPQLERGLGGPPHSIKFRPGMTELRRTEYVP